MTIAEEKNQSIIDIFSNLTSHLGIPDSLWSSKKKPWGTADYTLQIYDTLFTLEGVPALLIPYLAHLQMGTSEIAVKWKVNITLWKSPVMQFNNAYLTDSSEYRTGLSKRDQFIEFYGYFYAARFCTDTKKIDVFFANADNRVLAGELENFLRIASNLHLQERGVYLFHSSAVTYRESTYVFFGPHNAGKSTIALMSPKDALVLGDDLNALVIGQDPPNCHVVSLPFPSEVTKIRPLIKRPIRSLFRLTKGNTNKILPLSPSHKIAALIGSMPILNKIPEALQAVMPDIHRICRTIPLYELEFHRDGDIYSWITQNLPCQNR